jgi:glycosyltransferase involved in cell wall biosynthesis
MKYAVITPVRDEEANLRRLGDCMLAQAVQPGEWIIVDNGSTDGTLDAAEALSTGYPWIKVVIVAGEPAPLPGAPIVRAFKAGLAALDTTPEVVVKLDADISLDSNHFVKLLDQFARRPRLGIASGSCFELEAGAWTRTHVTGDSVRGAARAYRRECLDEVGPLEERMGWDTVDEVRATVRGWETGIIDDLPFFHHRRVGARDGGTKRWRALGESSYYMGYRWSYLALRALHNARRDPGALMMIPAFLGAALHREPRLEDEAVIRCLRSQQRLRHLRRRAREKSGHPPRRGAASAPSVD